MCRVMKPYGVFVIPGPDMDDLQRMGAPSAAFRTDGGPGMPSHRRRRVRRTWKRAARQAARRDLARQRGDLDIATAVGPRDRT